MHDGRERISEIALFQRIAQHHLVNFGRFFRRNQSFSHRDGLNREDESGKMRISEFRSNLRTQGLPLSALQKDIRWSPGRQFARPNE
jgi:hypothetical protein